METEIYINPKYCHLVHIINKIPNYYDSMGELIYIGRNQVRVLQINDIVLSIKSFGSITLANRYVYAHIRKPKATRSYNNSMRLIQNDINSPEPIAYINCYKKGILDNSYYISEYIPYEPLHNSFALPLNTAAQIIRSFARFTYKIHTNGIFHKDYNERNVLYVQKGNLYKFFLIDNNRMVFRRYTYRRGIRNLRRIDMPESLKGIFAEEYASEANKESLKTLFALVRDRVKFKKISSSKRTVKKLLKIKK